MSVLQLAASQGLSDLQQKFIVALVSAIIGASATLLVHVLKARAEPRKRISWDSSFDPGFAAIDDPEIQQKLNVTYDDVDVKNIFSIKYRVANTGNRVVKDQRFRFKFADGTQVLETYISPTPEPELKVELQSNSNPQELIYKIGHLERDQNVQFRFVVAGDTADQWKAVPSNEEGDVEVEKKGAAQKMEDRMHVRPFVISLFLFLTVPYAIDTSLIDEPIADALATIARFTFLASTLLHLAPVARTLRDLASRSEVARTGVVMHPVAYDGGTVVILGDGGYIKGNVGTPPPGDET
ncbi:hypothetical protein [Streptomyces sp. NBC_01443]|uniref:hypothetical protein n=1 Tax=Streptomyces sp. NBC_01443 TaxID=2903868 RepID=UPI00225B9721|nr:hypothetical protein [Streptomyces sp. NBC_01443]MCX4627544.1 hypothetical protein [Streptomyces sp. NBC_01443]